jgi:hypothetical protein
MGCQNSIAETIITKKVDYALGLKGNQDTLHEHEKLYFEDAVFKDDPYGYYETIDGDHGQRLELQTARQAVRHCY